MDQHQFQMGPSQPDHFHAELPAQVSDIEASMMPRRGAPVDRANGLISLVVLAAILGCVAIAVYPLVSELSLPRETDPLSLMFWLRGEKMTGEEWLQRNALEQQREWDEMYRKSPAYLDSNQFGQGIIYQPDWSQFKQNNDWANNWQKNWSNP